MAKTRPDTVIDPAEQSAAEQAAAQQAAAEQAAAAPAPSATLLAPVSVSASVHDLPSAFEEPGPNPTLGEILEYEARKRAS